VAEDGDVGVAVVTVKGSSTLGGGTPVEEGEVNSTQYEPGVSEEVGIF